MFYFYETSRLFTSMKDASKAESSKENSTNTIPILELRFTWYSAIVNCTILCVLNVCTMYEKCLQPYMCTRPYYKHTHPHCYTTWAYVFYMCMVTIHNTGPCITNVIATCRKNFSQWESSFLWKLRCHWLKFLRRVAKTLVIQGPGMQQCACN